VGIYRVFYPRTRSEETVRARGAFGTTFRQREKASQMLMLLAFPLNSRSRLAAIDQAATDRSSSEYRPACLGTCPMRSAFDIQRRSLTRVSSRTAPLPKSVSWARMRRWRAGPRRASRPSP